MQDALQGAAQYLNLCFFRQDKVKSFFFRILRGYSFRPSELFLEKTCFRRIFLERHSLETCKSRVEVLSLSLDLFLTCSCVKFIQPPQPHGICQAKVKNNIILPGPC